MGEKRKNKRRINRRVVKFGKNSCDKTAYTSNFSSTGFFIRTRRIYEAGTRLHFEFESPGGKAVQLEGEVVHSHRFPVQFASVRKSGMGIEVVEGKEDYLALLKVWNVQK